MTIRSATPDDAAALADLARQTFFDTFAADNNPDDMAMYLQQAFSVAQQGSEIADPSITTLLVEVDGELIAYAQIKSDHVPDFVTDEAALELSRLYVRHGWHGRGVAQALMARAMDAARHRGAKTLWLGVWERNHRARAFYAKCGFRDVGDHIFLFGTDPQTDLVMQVSL